MGEVIISLGAIFEDSRALRNQIIKAVSILRDASLNLLNLPNYGGYRALARHRHVSGGYLQIVAKRATAAGGARKILRTVGQPPHQSK